jgi:hypothetical protein
VTTARSRVSKVSKTLLAGALLLSIALSLLVWLVGLPEVRPPTPVGDPNGFVAAEVNAGAGPTFFWLSTLSPLDPAKPRDTVLSIAISAFDVSKTTILLGGDFASRMSCYGDGLTSDRSPIRFDALPEDLQALAVHRYQYTPSAGSFGDSEGDQRLTSDGARELAVEMQYIRLHPTAPNREDRTYETSSGATKTTANHWGTIKCAMDGEGVWATDGRLYRATVPGMFVQADAVSEPSFAYVTRDLTFSTGTEYQLNYSNQTPNLKDGQHVNYSIWSRATDWGNSTEFVSVPDEVASFVSSANEKRYQFDILWIGFASAAIATLFLSAVKLVCKIAAGEEV